MREYTLISIEFYGVSNDLFGLADLKLRRRFSREKLLLSKI